MSLAEPHEDEMALAIMCQRSNMLSWVFAYIFVMTLGGPMNSRVVS